MILSAKNEVLAKFELFRGNGGGIEEWFSNRLPETVAEAIVNCEIRPLSCEEFNQLLILSHEAGVSRAFFRHYFCSNTYLSGVGLYDPAGLPCFHEQFLSTDRISSMDQLYWGLYRLYVDSLLLYGNIRQGFRSLRSKTKVEIEGIIQKNSHNTPAMVDRGDFLPLEPIARDDRYLIAEMACKTYAPREADAGALVDYLEGRRLALIKSKKAKPTFRQLISDTSDVQFPKVQLEFSLDEVLDDSVDNKADLERRLQGVIAKFASAREKALKNTKLYLSMISDLDVYVATSMRERSDFRAMSDFCDATFGNSRVKDLKLRYFDPTLSAAMGHEDKGLIECLMVKCASVLLYNAGARDSYGKDVEAAMAMSLGKPVIFFCDSAIRANFYRDVHPLARLINFETGVAGGALVTDNRDEVPELLSRIYRNKMQYEIEKKFDGYFILKDKLTGSIVRLQTDDSLLRETFWNYYNREAGLLDSAGS